jgi:hypothetical protein
VGKARDSVYLDARSQFDLITGHGRSRDNLGQLGIDTVLAEGLLQLVGSVFEGATALLLSPPGMEQLKRRELITTRRRRKGLGNPCFGRLRRLFYRRGWLGFGGSGRALDPDRLGRQRGRSVETTPNQRHGRGDRFLDGGTKQDEDPHAHKGGKDDEGTPRAEQASERVGHQGSDCSSPFFDQFDVWSQCHCPREEMKHRQRPDESED